MVNKKLANKKRRCFVFEMIEELCFHYIFAFHAMGISCIDF